MKTVMLIIPIVLCVLLLIVPVFEIFGLINYLDFIPHNEIVLAIVQTVFAVGATIALFVLKPTYDITGRIFLTLLAPIAILNSLCFADASWKFTVIFAVVWGGCAFALYYKFVPDSYFKATSAVFSVLLTIAFVVLYLINLIHGSISEQTLESSYPSMHGTYTAEVYTTKSIGGTGMSVEIAKTEPDFDNFIGYFQAKPITIYVGEEHETKTAIITWLDDETVIINDTAYRAVTNTEE